MRRRCLLLFAVLATGPLGIYLAPLLDLFAVVGFDVLVLSMLYYFLASLSDTFRRSIEHGGQVLARSGVVAWQPSFAESRTSRALYVGHNLCVLVTPLRFIALAFLCFAIAPFVGGASMP